MKKTVLTLALALAACAAMAVDHSRVRIDLGPVDAKKPEVKIEQLTGEKGGEVKACAWMPKEVQPYNFFAQSPWIGAETKAVVFSFVPAADGNVRLTLRAHDQRNAAGKREPVWMVIDAIEITGAEAPNTKLDSADGKKVPGWYFAGRGALVKENGQNAIRVAHDHGANTVLKVKKGEKVTIKCQGRFDKHDEIK